MSEHVGVPTEPVQEGQTAEQFIVDNAAGVPGYYCIARKQGAFCSFWNPDGWAGSGYVFEDRRIAQALIDAASSVSALTAQFQSGNSNAELRAEVERLRAALHKIGWELNITNLPATMRQIAQAALAARKEGEK